MKKNIIIVLASLSLAAACSKKPDFEPDTILPKDSNPATQQPSQTQPAPTADNNRAPTIQDIKLPDPLVVEPKPLPPPATDVPNTIPAPSPSKTDGEVAFGVYGILNMASNYQITNDGFRIQVRESGSNEVLISSKLNLDALVDGEPIDFEPNMDVLARPFLLRAKNPQYVNPKLNNIRGVQKAIVSVCLPSDLNQSHSEVLRCKNLHSDYGHANGINTMDSLTADVDFKSNNEVLVKAFHNIPRRSGDYCQSKRGLPCVAIGHPALAGVLTSAGVTGEDRNSPLVFALDGANDPALLDAWDDTTKVYFDLLAIGEKQRIGWVRSQQGLLVLDVNKNGKIDDGSELFGEFSHRVNKKETAKLANDNFSDGYVALAQYDLNKDGVINHKDKIFNKLMIWQDSNQDGISQKSELKKLKYYGIKSINVVPSKVSEEKINVANNKVLLESTYETAKGVFKTFDVWFAVRLYENSVLSQNTNK